MIDLEKFPFENIREKQKKIIEKINENDEKKYVILEAETGTGKSAIAITACRSYDYGYIITSTRQLQDQYYEDFGNDFSLGNMKGKKAYRCAEDELATCNNGRCLYEKKIFKKCMTCGNCPYYSARDKADLSNIFLTNYHYFLSASSGEGGLKKRKVLVIGECHLLEDILSEWAKIDLWLEELNNKYDLLEGLDIKKMVELNSGPYYDDNSLDKNVKWIKEIYNLLISKKDELKEIIDFNSSNKKKSELSGLLRTEDEIEQINDDLNSLTNLITKIEQFLTDKNKDKNWLITQYANDGITLTPLDVSWLFKRYIDSKAIDKIIFMSATILDLNIFKKAFDLDDEKTICIRCESDFNPDKSPIIIQPTCKMDYNSLKMEENLSKIANKVEEILELHNEEKGIIHAGNAKIIKYLKDHIDNDRMLYRLNDITNDTIVWSHQHSKEPTVLVSSSLAEGVDLKDDLSRFQIIIKLPFANLQDVRIKKKSKMGDWYLNNMFMKFVQQCGRSTRNIDDFSKTYVLDGSFWYWFHKAKEKGWFSGNFLRRIKK